MKVLDRYIIRELLAPIIICSLTLVVLILIADLFDNLDDLLENRTSLGIIFKYYLCLIPYAFVETISWAAWLGTVFLLVNFGLHNETIAMKVAGLKIVTIVRPILFFGFLLGILTFLISDRVVPKTFKMAHELREVHIEAKKAENSGEILQNVTYYSGGKRLFYFRFFDTSSNHAEDAIVLWFDEKQASTRQKMVSEEAVYESGKWEFRNVLEYQMDSRGRILGEPRSYPSKSYPEIVMTPDDLINTSQEAGFLSYRELKQSIKKLHENGVNVYSENVDLYYRLASPWQTLVMMMITIPLLAPTRNRKMIAGQVLICVGFIFLFHMSNAVGIALGKAGKVFPFFSAWMGNIFFGAAALLNLDNANY